MGSWYFDDFNACEPIATARDGFEWSCWLLKTLGVAAHDTEPKSGLSKVHKVLGAMVDVSSGVFKIDLEYSKRETIIEVAERAMDELKN